MRTRTLSVAVAEVSFACGPIYPGDIAVPFQSRTIPEYVPAKLDRFALPNGKTQGAIVAARNNFASLANGDIVYLRNFVGAALVAARGTYERLTPRGRRTEPAWRALSGLAP